MAVGINLGNFDIINGKSVSAGIVSGLDTKAIVDGLVEIKKLPIKAIEDKVSNNSKRLEAYSNLATLSKSFQSTSDRLRASPYFGYNANDSFKKRQVYVTSSDGSSANSYIGVAASNGALVRKYNVKINELATAKTQMSGAFSSKSASVTLASGSNMAGKFNAGSFSINGKTVTLSEGDNLLEIQAKINALTTDSNVEADIIQVADNDFRLVLASTQTGVANGYTISDPSNVLNNISFTATSAHDAEIVFNGITVTRSSNIITDLVENVTFSLYQKTGSITLTTEVAPATSAMLEDITAFVGAYNDLKMFLAKMQERDPETGVYKEEAVFGGDTNIEHILNNILSEISKTVSGLDSDCKNLADCGIEFKDYDGDDKKPATKNTLDINAASLSKMLEEELDEMCKVFMFNFTSSSSKLTITERTNALALNDFTVDINATRPEGTQVIIYYVEGGVTKSFYADYDPTDTGGVITGKAGTKIAGLKMYYAGNGIDSINIHASQGIADRLYNYLNELNESTSGLLKTTKDLIAKQSDQYKNEISNKSEEIEEYRRSMLFQYQAVEQAISRVNSLLQFLDAQMRAREAYNR